MIVEPMYTSCTMLLASASLDSREADYSGPSAPTPGVLLYKSEEKCDFTFTVSPKANDLNGWRFPGHSFIVENASPIFKKMIEDRKSEMLWSLETLPTILIQSNPKTFDLLMSYVYKREVNLNSVANCLDLFALSNRFQVYELSYHCLSILLPFISVYNVLSILAFLREETKNPDCSPCNENIVNEVISKCFSILDENADSLLHSEEIENVDQLLLIEILSRNTLTLVSEATAFSAINRWANEQCLKQRLELTANNKRSVLGEALFCVRYLVMNSEEFLKGPFVSDLLTEEEKNCFSAYIRGGTVELPVNLSGKNMDVKRNIVKPSALVSPNVRCNHPPDDAVLNTNTAQVPQNNEPSDVQDANSPNVDGKNKKSICKKFARGIGDLVICAIQLID